MPLPPAEAVARLIEADIAASGVAPESHAFYVAIVSRIFAAIRLADVLPLYVAPPGGGAVTGTGKVT